MMRTLRRILAIARKELLVLMGTRQSRFMVLIPPVIQIFIFAWAATMEVKNVDVVVINEDSGVLEPGGHQPAARFADLQAHHVRGRFQEGRGSHQPSGCADGDALPERLFRQSGAGRARRSAIVAGRAAIQHRPDFDAVCPADRTGAGNGDARFRAGQAFPRRGRGAECSLGTRGGVYGSGERNPMGRVCAQGCCSPFPNEANPCDVPRIRGGRRHLCDGSACCILPYFHRQARNAFESVFRSLCRFRPAPRSFA